MLSGLYCVAKLESLGWSSVEWATWGSIMGWALGLANGFTVSSSGIKRFLVGFMLGSIATGLVGIVYILWSPGLTIMDNWRSAEVLVFVSGSSGGCVVCCVGGVGGWLVSCRRGSRWIAALVIIGGGLGATPFWYHVRLPGDSGSYGGYVHVGWLIGTMFSGGQLLSLLMCRRNRSIGGTHLSAKDALSLGSKESRPSCVGSGTDPDAPAKS